MVFLCKFRSFSVASTVNQCLASLRIFFCKFDSEMSRFQQSPETISRHFTNILKALCIFWKEVDMPPDFQNVHMYIRCHENYFPWFEDCVGANDGTHISAWLPINKQIPYRGWKSKMTQNVIAACDFNTCFSFILTDWEGSAHDAIIFGKVNSSLQFPQSPEEKYYSLTLDIQTCLFYCTL